MFWGDSWDVKDVKNQREKTWRKTQKQTKQTDEGRRRKKTGVSMQGTGCEEMTKHRWERTGGGKRFYIDTAGKTENELKKARGGGVEVETNAEQTILTNQGDWQR